MLITSGHIRARTARGAPASTLPVGVRTRRPKTFTTSTASGVTNFHVPDTQLRVRRHRGLHIRQSRRPLRLHQPREALHGDNESEARLVRVERRKASPTQRVCTCRVFYLSRFACHPVVGTLSQARVVRVGLVGAWGAVARWWRVWGKDLPQKMPCIRLFPLLR